MQNLCVSIVSRLEALEDNQLERDSLGVDFAALVAELSAINFSVKTLTEAMN